MKKVTLMVLGALALFGADYTTMSLEELQSLRGTVPQEERAAFSSAMQAKMNALTPEERAAAQATMKQSKSGTGSGTMTRQGGGGGGAGGGSGAMRQQRGQNAR